jgi:hypothetical protein
MSDNQQVIHFFHGDESKIQDNIDSGNITASDFVVTTDDDLVYVAEETTDDSTKLVPRTLGSAKVKEDITVKGTTVGNLTDETTITAGTDLTALLKQMLTKRIPHEYTAPTVEISSTKKAMAYEVGESITSTITGKYNQNEAGDIVTLSLKKGDTLIASSNTNTVSAEDETFTLSEGELKFTVTATYEEGPIENDNLGDASPDGHIEAGSISKSLIFTGQRKYFYGAGVGSVPELDSAAIRALSGSALNPNNNTSFSINIAVGQQYVVFAYPARLRDVSQVMYVETNDTGMASSFTQSTIDVEGANGADAVSYKVYTYGMATPAAAGMTFKVTI